MTTKHRVLVVDDYPDAAEIACTLLTMMGHDCQAASSGREALATARTFAPDVAILDIGLPDLSGYEVARALRQLEHGAAIYIAAITGWGLPADRMRSFEAGFDQHILKPADRAKLTDILRRADLRMRSRAAGMPERP